MSKFVKESFNFDGLFLTYGVERRFVARFKYTKDNKSFVSFLTKNFEVEEYFTLLEDFRVPPLQVLETKGYVSPTVKKLLKSLGYAQDAAGKKQYLEDQVKKYQAAVVQQ